jgi:hypothetical protein
MDHGSGFPPGVTSHVGVSRTRNMHLDHQSTHSSVCPSHTRPLPRLSTPPPTRPSVCPPFRPFSELVHPHPTIRPSIVQPSPPNVYAPGPRLPAHRVNLSPSTEQRHGSAFSCTSPLRLPRLRTGFTQDATGPLRVRITHEACGGMDLRKMRAATFKLLKFLLKVDHVRLRTKVKVKPRETSKPRGRVPLGSKSLICRT